MSYKVSTGLRKPVFTFKTNEEAVSFNKEYFAKNKVRGAISVTTDQPTYKYTSDGKLVPM